MDNKDVKQIETNKNSKLYKFLNFFKKLNPAKFVFKTYYYVPPCPKCKSYLTGRFMRELSSSYDTNWRMETALKNGEIIAAKSNSKYNCFCLLCGNEWNDEIKFKLLSLKEIAEQRELRKTPTLYSNYKKAQEETFDSKKKKSRLERFMGHF